MVSSWHQLNRIVKPAKQIEQSKKPKESKIVSICKPHSQIQDKANCPITATEKSNVLAMLKEGYSFEYAVSKGCDRFLTTKLKNDLKQFPEIKAELEKRAEKRFASHNDRGLPTEIEFKNKGRTFKALLLNHERAMKLIPYIDDDYSLAYAWTLLFGPVRMDIIRKQIPFYPELEAALERRRQRTVKRITRVKKG